MAQKGLNLYFSGFTGYLIVIWKKATAPLTEVGRSDAIPFPVSQIIVAPNLSPEVYNFEFWQSSDGIALDTLLPNSPWSIDAADDSDVAFRTYEYIVDGGRTNITEITGTEVWADPVQDDTEIEDERYAGVAKEDIQVSMRGTGLRRSDEWNVRSLGGIQLSVSGEVFNTEDSIFVTVVKKLSTPPSTTSSDYTDVLNVNANTTVDATFKNKLINCTGSSDVIVLTFPAFNTMADQKMKISTHGFTGNYVQLLLSGTNSISINGADRSPVYIASGRFIELLWKSNICYVLSGDPGYDVRGKRDFADDIKSNQRLRDGTILQTSEYPGTVEWINTLPVSSIVGTRASWNTDDNRNKFYLNESLGEFSFPDDRNMHVRALSAFDGSVAIGRYEADQNKAHTHTTEIPSRDFKNDGTTGPDLTGADGGATSGSKRTFTSSSDGGSEGTVKNYGQLAIINL